MIITLILILLNINYLLLSIVLDSTILRGIFLITWDIAQAAGESKLLKNILLFYY